MRAKMDDRAWVEKHFAALERVAAKAMARRPDVLEHVGAWTVLKQLAIKNILGVYLPILRNQPWAKRLVYIDTHAGCGINALRDTKRQIAGTALLPFAGGDARFAHYHYVEIDDAKRTALEERLSLFLPKDQYTIYPEPAIDAIKKIVAAERVTGTHQLCVVDPYSMSQINWDGLAQIMKASPGDLVINFPTTEPKRTTQEIAESFFGTGAVRGLLTAETTEQDLLDFFLARLQEHRPVVRTVRIQSGEGRFYYDLVYATRKTRSDSKFVAAIDEVRARVEGLTGADVMRIIGNRRLGSFGEAPRRNSQRKLDDRFQ